MTHMISLQEAKLRLPLLGFAPSTEKNIRAALNKSVRTYRKPLSEIQVDPVAMRNRWGTGRVRDVPKPFQNASELRTYRKNLYMLADRMAGLPARTVLAPAWAAILTEVRENQGPGKVLGANSDLTIGVVLREASRDGMTLPAITSDWINRVSLRLPNDLRKSYCRGLDGINRMIERQDRLPGCAGLLPAMPLPQPKELRPAVNSWRRSAGNPAASPVWMDFDDIMHLKKFGESGPQIKGTPVEFKQSSIDAYETSMNWFLRELLAQDRLDEGAELREVITHANLVAAVNHWISDRTARGLSATTSTLHNHVTRLVHLAVSYLDASPREAKRLQELRKKPAIRTKSVGGMSVQREQWIEEFHRDVAKQQKAHFLPELLMKRSKAILARAAGNKKVPPGEVMMALKLGIAAAQTAILLRASPIRSTNLRTLRMRGEGAGFDVTELLEDPRLRELRLTVPGCQVKNGANIDEMADDDLAPIVRWYLAEIRPALVSAHPFGKNYVDSDYLFPSTRADTAMERSGFAAMFRTACTEVGFDMTMHQARHVCAYWILSVDPNAWAEAAALLGDDEMTVRKYYGWLDTRQASAAARDKLRQKRAFTSKHPQGDYENA